MSKLSLREINQSQLDTTPVIDGQLIVCLDTGNAYRDSTVAHVKIGSDLEVVSELPLAPLANKIYFLKPDKLYMSSGGELVLLNAGGDLNALIEALPEKASAELGDDTKLVMQDTDTTNKKYFRYNLGTLWTYIRTKATEIFAPKDHTHTKSQITDFPTSMPASDVKDWAKANTKPSYTWDEIGKKPDSFTPATHNHDERYYTESEVDSKLAEKANNNEAGANSLLASLNTSWSAAPTDDTYFIRQDTGGTNAFGRLKFSTLWTYIKGKADSTYQAKGNYAASDHNHDSRYYTESEIDSKLDSKVQQKLITESVDFNTLTDTGIYHIKSISNTNCPHNNHGTLCVDFTVGTPFQLFWPDSNAVTAYKRWRSGSEWSSWVQLKFTDTNTWAGIIDKPTEFTPAAHTHDDRYYTESEMDTRLGEKLSLSGGTMTGHIGFKDGNALPHRSSLGTIAGFDPYSSGGTLVYSNASEVKVGSASKADTAGTADVANSVDWSKVQNKPSSYTPSSHTHTTKNITHDNSTNFAGGAGPIESAHIDVLRANRLAFLPASGVTVEYSTDGGSTWVDYGATDAQKAGLFTMKLSGGGAAFYAGKHTAAADCTSKDQLRITVSPVDRYCAVNMLYLWVTIAGTTATVDIARSTIGAKATFTNVRTDVLISGWSGPNEIRFNQGTFGGGTSQTSNAYSYRFTFKNKADAKGYVCIYDIRMYGPSAWQIPNDMVMSDHMYSWDNNKNVTFPAIVTAPTFNGNLDWSKVTNKPSTYAPAAHEHDLSAMINKLTTGGSTPVDADYYVCQYAGGGTTTTTYHRRPMSALWNYIKGKTDTLYQAKGSYAASDHNHDSRYYTESEIDSKLAGKLPLSGGTVTGRITREAGGAWIQGRNNAVVFGTKSTKDNYNPAVGQKTLNGAWTMGNLSGNESLVFNYEPDSNYNSGTNGTSVVYLPAQAGTIITSATIGNQTVSKAGSCTGNSTTATTAAKLGRNGSTGTPMTFYWSGQSGQPPWLWGGTDGTNMYVYNPSNFSVNYASSAGSVAWGNVSGKPSTYTPSSHTHNYAGSSSAGGTANSVNGYIFGAQSSDPGAGSSLTTNKILFIYD